ncbi:endolytic transglycosylase MltG [Domibacillus epiphyticus]|uniref:Aminodeoxychorismate lyase n=1 Tax=Domibacillus epiphyticus TaxID=1714355 RepID=A0A1V2A9K6_9BACI|nr:endolytic transglycosylase MltG [Domibacillus epiphyticus]OMP67673.1 hypothetical protein BTO28_06945 [Domibacillus epiphyticus]
MTKQSLRSFGFGLLAASAALFVFDYTSTEKTLTEEEMISALEENNYSVQIEEEKNEKLEKKPVEAEPVNTEAPVKGESPEQEQQNVEKNKIKVTIETGMSSKDVVNELAEAGVIDDAESFNTYLTENDFASDLQIGTFTFSPNMSDEEIAKTLTK